ncbi:MULTISPECIES: hypothetical protein [unclassified Sphingomonas]|uniref:hypothetical protein n=1 Tax=unclassified Sphingomonas TaxID=196159 RepID=UPI0006F402A6|nr:MULTISPECIES: hypothetical protein [unclassified Sphingomonas]KQX18434.1 hypothetical protein ASD17_14830 [Sphingomonas sp. Root1294]KQY72241.1 hypothetical protein ASD39_20145 [Sphingomonas sp. Root50]KRB94488.1 hypothetical protein ASE22_00605 [Sphingomonas sp. Root720]
MNFDDLLSLAQSAAKIVTASGLIPGAAPIVDAVNEIVDVVRRNVEQGKDVLAADQIEQLNTILDQVHARVLSVSDRLDKAAEAASKR